MRLVTKKKKSEKTPTNHSRIRKKQGEMEEEKNVETSLMYIIS